MGHCPVLGGILQVDFLICGIGKDKQIVTHYKAVIAKDITSAKRKCKSRLSELHNGKKCLTNIAEYFENSSTNDLRKLIQENNTTFAQMVKIVKRVKETC